MKEIGVPGDDRRGIEKLGRVRLEGIVGAVKLQEPLDFRRDRGGVVHGEIVKYAPLQPVEEEKHVADAHGGIRPARRQPVQEGAALIRAKVGVGGPVRKRRTTQVSSTTSDLKTRIYQAVVRLIVMAGRQVLSHVDHPSRNLPTLHAYRLAGTNPAYRDKGLSGIAPPAPNFPFAR